MIDRDIESQFPAKMLDSIAGDAEPALLALDAFLDRLTDQPMPQLYLMAADVHSSAVGLHMHLDQGMLSGEQRNHIALGVGPVIDTLESAVRLLRDFQAGVKS